MKARLTPYKTLLILPVQFFLLMSIIIIIINTGRFIMFSVITNIYNKKTKGPTLMELFTATGKLKKFFLTTRDVRCVHHGDTAHIYKIFKFLARTLISYRCVPCHP